MEKYKIAHFGIFDESELSLEIIAIYHNDLETLVSLLGENVNKTIYIHCEYIERFTPLEVALYLNKKEIIEYLLKNNGRTKKGKYHKTAIEIAVRYCDPEIVILLKKDLEFLSEEKK